MKKALRHAPHLSFHITEELRRIALRPPHSSRVSGLESEVVVNQIVSDL